MVAGTNRHEHGPASGADARWLSGALALILAFMAGEVIAGVAAHSLALISDAAHMLTDAASIALVLVTARLAARPPGGGYTYGLKRTEIMSAQANGITLVLLAAWLAYTAIRHLVTPPAVTGGTVLGVALAGVAVNVAATLLIARAGGGHGAPRSLNLAGAFRHIVTDLYAFAATASRRHVTEVHDLHIWEITSGMPAASAHVLVAPGEDCHAVRADLEAYLSREYGITHATLQVDHAGLPAAPGLMQVSPEQHCDDAHGPAYRPGDGR